VGDASKKNKTMKEIKLSLTFAVTLILFACNDQGFGSELNKKTRVEVGKDRLEFHLKSWGITGNHSLIKLYNPTTSHSDTLEFHEDILFYKVEGEDSIVIYTSGFKGEESDLSITDIKVKVIQEFDFQNYLRNHDEIGLGVISGREMD
jgi:hypothetical protein